MTGARAFQELLRSEALPLGLGCSRLGSVGGASKDESRDLLRMALDAGIRVFDTANIYGQGDSERILAEALRGRADYVLISKAGKYVARHRRALVPLKGIMRATARGYAPAQHAMTSVRSKPMPTNWNPRHLTGSLEQSLRRLGVDHVQVFMLHGPPADVIRAGHAVAALEDARQAGKIGLVGVSVDDVETATACLMDTRIQAIQLPIRPKDTEYDGVLRTARTAGVAVIAREILGGIGAAAAQGDPAAFARNAIATALRDDRITIPLVGSTRIVNLSATIDAVKAALAGDL